MPRRRGRLAQKLAQGRQGGVADVGGKLSPDLFGAGDRKTQRPQEPGQADRLVIALSFPVRLGAQAVVVAFRSLGSFAFKRLGGRDSARRHDPHVAQPYSHAHGEETVPKLGAERQEPRRIVVPRPLRNPRRRDPQLIGALRHRLDHLERRRVAGGGGG